MIYCYPPIKSTVIFRDTAIAQERNYFTITVIIYTDIIISSTKIMNKYNTYILSKGCTLRHSALKTNYTHVYRLFLANSAYIDSG